MIFTAIHSLKLTQPLKIDGWKTFSFPFGFRPIFSGELGELLILGRVYTIKIGYMGVSKNRGIPKSSILIGVFHYFHHPFWGKTPPIFGSTPTSSIAMLVYRTLLQALVAFEAVAPMNWGARMNPLPLLFTLPETNIFAPENRYLEVWRFLLETKNLKVPC